MKTPCALLLAFMASLSAGEALRIQARGVTIGNGNGVAVGKHSIITCAHILFGEDQKQRPAFVEIQGAYRAAEVVRLDAAEDLALLRVKEDLKAEELIDLPDLIVTGARGEIGPKGAQQSEVTSRQCELLSFFAKAANVGQGISGSPAFFDGKLAGIVKGTDLSESGVSMIPANRIREFLDASK